MDKSLATKAYLRQQARKAADYFKPTQNVRVRDFVREVPGAVGQMFSGTRDTVVNGGKILGEGLAYATSPNVRKMYQAGNTDILPTVSNTTPRQMLANTTKSAFEIAPVGKIRGIAKAAMSAKLMPRVAAGGAMGYGYDVADKMTRPEPVNAGTLAPGMATLAGALMAGISRPTTQMLHQAGSEMADDLSKYPVQNRLKKEIVPLTVWKRSVADDRLRNNPNANNYSLRTTVEPFEPKSYLARVLMGKQSPVGNSIQAVDDPLLQEAGKKGVIRSGDKYGHSELGNADTDEMVARERFDIPNLKKVSFGGSDRDVYDLGDGNVVKISKNSRGLDQNQFSSDNYAEGAGLIPKTIEAGRNYIVKEKVDAPDANVKAMVSELKKLYNLSSGGFYNRDEHFRELDKAYQILEKYGYPSDDLRNYGDILWGDMQAIRNWGTKNGKPIMLDEGTLNGGLVKNASKNAKGNNANLEEPEFRAIYNQSRAAKKKYGDTDKKTMYGIAALLGLGGLNQSQEK